MHKFHVAFDPSFLTWAYTICLEDDTEYDGYRNTLEECVEIFRELVATYEKKWEAYHIDHQRQG